jgi:hypothetical protein
MFFIEIEYLYKKSALKEFHKRTNLEKVVCFILLFPTVFIPTRLFLGMCPQPHAVAASHRRQCGRNHHACRFSGSPTGFLLRPLEIIEFFIFYIILTSSSFYSLRPKLLVVLAFLDT